MGVSAQGRQDQHSQPQVLPENRVPTLLRWPSIPTPTREMLVRCGMGITTSSPLKHAHVEITSQEPMGGQKVLGCTGATGMISFSFFSVSSIFSINKQVFMISF